MPITKINWYYFKNKILNGDFLREQIVRPGYYAKIKYSNENWELLKEFRNKAINLLNLLRKNQIHGYVYGSVARGDVSKDSDIDIIIPQILSSFKLETIIDYDERYIVQATPSHTIKAEIHIDSNTTIIFPLIKMRTLELEFYKFGGIINLNQLMDNKRVPGIDKRLLIINPKEYGHEEISLIGNEQLASKLIGINKNIINERIRVLSRRNEIGRTGVYLKYKLKDNENFETVLKKIIDSDPAIRRTYIKRSKRK